MLSYLREKGVIARKPRDLPPVSVSPEVLARFESDGNPSPDVSSPQLDWRSRIDSAWNKSMLVALAHEFLQRIDNGHIKNIAAQSVSFDQIIGDMRRRMEDARKNYRVHQCPESDITQLRVIELAKNRRHGRRHNVSQYSICSVLTNIPKKIYARRWKTVKHHEVYHPDVWTPIKEVLQALGTTGMSDDETEDESVAPPNSLGGGKVVRRIQLSWLSPDVSKLWKAVDSYCSLSETTQYAGKFPSEHRGNNPCLRLWESTMRSSTRDPVVGLPRNFYDIDWWTAQPPAWQSKLEVTNPIPIPTLVRCPY